MEQYRIFELVFDGCEPASAIFTCGDIKRQVRGFRKGAVSVIRFMPDTVGTWQYKAECGAERRSGEFTCTPAEEGNHGPVHAQGFGFSYADGTRCLPFGTTCYVWTYQSEKTIASTLSSLEQSAFNKVRMCVFPKFMAFNNDEPSHFPFEKKEDGWDVTKPDERFWSHFETCIAALDKRGIEAEIILFHPYDKWGFPSLTREDSLVYLRYCVHRLSAYKNVWWSLANEYDLLTSKTAEDWDSFGVCIAEEDIYRHPVSIHDFCAIYPPCKWMSHVSVQSAYPSRTILWRAKYHLPVIVDELGYEGDLPFHWGNLSAKEYVLRMWEAVMGGGYCTHGETFYSEDEIIWWAKGGTLRGEAVARVRFLKELLEELPPLSPAVDLGKISPDATVDGQFTAFGRAMEALTPSERDETMADMIPPVLTGEGCSLWYLRGCPAWADVSATGEGEYEAEVIDAWNMTRKIVGTIQGSGRISLPAREGMAVLLKRKL